MRKINEDLTLNYIEDSVVKNNELITVGAWFSFCGKSYVAYVKVQSLDNERLNIPSIEGPGILFESFEEAIESKEVEDVLREEIKKHIEEYWYE